MSGKTMRRNSSHLLHHLRLFVVPLVVLLLACGGGSDEAAAGKPPAQVQGSAGQVGINLPQLSYWDQSFAMADVVRQSSITNSAGGLDADGAPLSDFNLFVSSTNIGAGTYKLSFAGQAVLGINAQPERGRIENQRYDAASNLTTADVVLPGISVRNTWLTFRDTKRSAQSSTADGVTKLHLWRPGYAPSNDIVFTREFIQAMQTVQVLRAMDSLNTNTDNVTVSWADRTRPDYIGRTDPRGQSIEWLVALANATGRDIWVNVPIFANEDYMTKLAQLLRYGSDGNLPYTTAQAHPAYPPLNAGLKVYVEYANELWNWGFQATHWLTPIVDAAAADPSHPINFDGAAKGRERARYIAWRSALISEKFRAVWGAENMGSRVRPILASQVGNANALLSEGLIWAAGYYKTNDLSGIWWGGGGAPYYGGGSVDIKNPTAVQDYFDAQPEQKVVDKIKLDTVWTQGFGLRNVAYEGGPEPGTGVKGEAGKAIANTLNTDPRMAQAMSRMHDAWNANGGDLFVYYNYTSMGDPWRFVDETKNPTASDTSSVKMQFLASLATRPVAALTLGGAVPGTVALRDPAAEVVHRGDSSGSWANNGAWLLRENGANAHNEFLLVPVRTTRAGRYAVSVVTLAKKERPSLELLVNGQSIDVVTQPPADAGAAVASSAAEVNLPEGLSVVRIQLKEGAEAWPRDLVFAAR
ncbi:hypothetical protein [Comamonas flocculans]|uniref:Uncharacterized protein n=1 Tax=Comamonas flocculans TaxID=2597701 RepID=A0A5B8RUY9_9BURK|nr:hypothetical protein [Comamonas flocculans]QEA12494.1 hypothetical protein FOZ74_05310 [Comamonas flocculans]